MKQRITYIVPDSATFSPKDHLKHTKTAFGTWNLRAFKEHHLTIGLDELPQEVPLTPVVSSTKYFI